MSLKFRKGLVFILLFAGCFNARKGDKAQGFDEWMQATIDSLHKTNNFPGILVGLEKNGRRQYFTAGLAHPSQKTRFDSTTVFEIGSLTKTVTAFVLQSLLNQHSIADSAGIINYLPDSVKRNKNLAKISFLNLMNHTSGLSRLPANIDLASRQPYEAYDQHLLFSFLKSAQPREPGEYEYSNLGYGLAGLLSSNIGNKPFTELVNEIAFKQAGILQRQQDIPGRKNAVGHLRNEEVEFWRFDALAGAGYLQLNAMEVLDWLAFIGKAKANKALVDDLLLPRFKISPEVHVCKAWHTIDADSKHRVYWHNGGTYGFSVFGAFDREAGNSVIVVINQFDRNGITDALGVRILRMLANK